VDRLIARTRADVDRLLEQADRRPAIGVTLRCVRDLLSIDVRDRIFGLAGQSFLAFVPLLILASSAFAFGDDRGLAGLINARLQLDEQTASIVVLLFSSPSALSQSTSVISAVILLLSVNSYTRTMRRSIERPWMLPRYGWRAQLHGLAAVGVFMAMLFSVAVVATAWRGGPVVTAVPEVLVQTLMAVGFWWVITYLLASRRIPWRHLLPGAVAGGVAQSAAGWWTVAFLPGILEKDAGRYGVIGVSLSIVTWLLVLSGITVGVGIVGARIARAVGWLPDDDGRDTSSAAAVR
jgi:membrane protein